MPVTLHRHHREKACPYRDRCPELRCRLLFPEGCGYRQGDQKLVEFIRKSVPERHAEHEIAEWERFYQSVVENQPDLIFRINPEGTISYVNEAGVHFFKKTYDELQGDNFFSRIPDADRSLVLLRLQSISAIKPDLLLEHRVSSGDRKLVPLLWSYRGFFTTQGAVTEYQVSGRDTAAVIRIGTPEPVKPAAPVSAPQAPAATPGPGRGGLERACRDHPVAGQPCLCR